MFCVRDSVTIQRSKEHSVCKFTEAHKKKFKGGDHLPSKGHMADGVGKLVIKQFIHDAGAMQISYFPLSFAGNNRKYIVKSGKCCEPGPQFKRVNHCNGMGPSTMRLALKFKVV